MKHLLVFFTFMLPLCAFSQINESFNNPEITATYPWEGDLDRFKSGSDYLQLNDMSRSTDAKVYLYGATLGENEWTFRIKSGYKTTDYNYFRVYLWSDNPDANKDNFHTSYFIELGRGQQRITLCRNTGGNRTDILLSRAISNLNDAFDLHIHIVSTNSGQISLYVRSDQKPEYTHIGTASYTPQIAPGYFILYCKYTGDHSKNKYFGPVHIKNFSLQNIQNPEELRILSMEQTDASTLDLTFNRIVNPAYASFSLTSLGAADRVYISDDEKQIRLAWDEEMKNGSTYTLSYQNIYDDENNSYQGTLPSFVSIYESEDQETIPPTSSIIYQPGDILINEVMADPKGVAGLPETEYIELYNTTNKAIDLTGWAFLYADKSTPLLSEIQAEGFAVLYRSGREIQVDNPGIGIPLSTFPAALANTGKWIGLKSPTGVLIDELDYPKAKAGYSWERTEEAWQYSTDKRGGTPGSPNSGEDNESGNNGNGGETEDKIISPYEIIFNELLPEPAIGGSEYIELYNRSNRRLPLSGLSIATRKTDGTLSTHYPLISTNKTLDIGEYAVLTKSIEGVSDFFLISNPENLFELKLPVLANTSSQLVLFRSSDLEVIDEVHYSDKWHSASVKNKKGIALERIDPDNDSQDPDNWTSASSLAGGGTPGYKNSQSGSGSGENATGIDAPEYIAISGTYSISYRLDRSGYNCRASVYDTSGRQIVELFNHELLGTEGALSWDGYAYGGQKPTTGVYIFYAELYHPEGGRKVYKKVFLVK